MAAFRAKTIFKIITFTPYDVTCSKSMPGGINIQAEFRLRLKIFSGLRNHELNEFNLFKIPNENEMCMYGAQ
jgi:hypothetical protein